MEEKKAVQIDIKYFVFALLRRWWIIVFAALIGAGGFYLNTKLNDPLLYSSSTMLYVNNSSKITYEGMAFDMLNSSNMTASTQLVKRCKIVLKTTRTLKEIRDVVNTKAVSHKYSVGELYGMVSLASVDETEFVKITVISQNAQDAYLIAETIEERFPDIMGTVVKGSTMEVADNAEQNNSPVSPSYTSSAKKGLLVGAGASVVIILLLAFFNDRLESDDWVKQAFGDRIPLLATIPDITQQHSSSHRYGYYRYGYYSQQKNQDSSDGRKK